MRQGPWTDLYALAAVMYGALAGKPPQASVARVLKDELVPAVVLGQGRFSPAWLQWIDRCMAVRPDQRPASMAAARALLMTSTLPLTSEVSVTQALNLDERTVLMPAAFAQAAASTNHPGVTSGPTSPWQGLSPDGDQDTVLRPTTVADSTLRNTPATKPALNAAVGATQAPPVAQATAVRASPPRRGWLMGAGAAAMVLLGAGAWWWSAPTAPLTGSNPPLPMSVPAPAMGPAKTPDPIPAPQALPLPADASPSPVPSTPPVGTQATAGVNPDEPLPKRTVKPRLKPEAPVKALPKSDTYGDAYGEAKPAAANRPAADECAALLQRASMGDTSPALMAHLQAARCR
jgi:hypothetical protein